uniref:ATP-dependent RNA helicase n=1 Tax=Botryllus schlosseri TaxID=30301 RepID=I6Z0G3_BOTSH|nr:ATP-dependent RNA helicase DDX1 [Botryllus schlosseri]
MTAFEELGVMPEIGKAVDEMGWMLPTDIQAESIPLILGGGDVLMAAETGSGKTGVFSIPVIQIVHESKCETGNASSKNASGNPLANKWQMNPHDRGKSFAISSDGLLCQCREFKEWQGCRSTRAVTEGKYYYEVTCKDEGLCRMGWSTLDADLNLGTDKYGFGFGGTGKKSFNRQFDTYGEPFTMHDVIGCYIDVGQGTIMFSKNGTDLGHAFDIPGHLRQHPFYATCVVKNAELLFNFGDSPFKYPPTAGYVGLSKAAQTQSIPSRKSGSAGASRQNKRKANNAPYAIIIEPSRELAEQTYNNVVSLKKHVKNPGISEVLIIGGVSPSDQLKCIENGVDIVVATPGRIDDFISSGKLSLDQVRFMVLDECDGLLSAGNEAMIKRMHSKMPQVTADGKRLQVIVCSAALHSFDVKKLAEKIMRFPTWVDLKGEDSVPETVHHVVVPVNPKKDRSYEMLRPEARIETDGVHQRDRVGQRDKPCDEKYSEAVKILKGEYCIKAIKKHNMDQCIIFCRTKLDCDNMERYFTKQNGGPKAKGHLYSCVCLHSDRRPPERRENLEKFKKGEVRHLICTDVAARGLDVKGIPFVINVTLPDEKQNYVHRIGRVGRAERMGLAISLVSVEHREKVWYHSNCNNRGKGCYNTNLTDMGGCCIWYDEGSLLADVEEHLKITIDQVSPDLEIPVNEFDGKVVYGKKRATHNQSSYKGHADSLAPAVKDLQALEKAAQTSFLQLAMDNFSARHT